MTRRADAISHRDAPPDLRHVWLADRPEAAETVAAWTHDAWGRAAGRSFDEEVALTRVFASAEPPMMLLALSDDTVVGSAALRLHEMPEYPDYAYWLSAVFVAPEARGRRIASSLVEAILEHAARLGIERLYLRTEDLTGGLYRHHGFEPVATIEDEGRRALLMRRSIEA